MCLSFILEKEQVDEEEKVTKSVILKDLLGDFVWFIEETYTAMAIQAVVGATAL